MALSGGNTCCCPVGQTRSFCHSTSMSGASDRPSSSCWQNLASSESPRPRQSFRNLLSTLALQKAEVTHLIQAFRRPRQRIAMNLRPALVYSVRPCLKTTTITTTTTNTKASSPNSWICPFSQLERPPIQKLSSEPLFN